MCRSRRSITVSRARLCSAMSICAAKATTPSNSGVRRLPGRRIPGPTDSPGTPGLIMTNEPSNIVVLPDPKDINARAAEWLVLLEEGNVSAEDLAAFRAWREASEKHRETFDRIAALWAGFERIKALDDLAVA